MTLWECLYGVRRFPGDSLSKVCLAILDNVQIDPPSGTKVPSWLRRVVTRGMAHEARDRWPSMEALLAALDRDPSRRRRSLAITGLALGLVAAVLGWRQLDRTRIIEACDADGQAITAAWSDSVRGASHTAFTASEFGYAAQTWARADIRIRDYMLEWSTLRTQACRETQLDHTRSEASLTRVEACLDERRADLISLTQTMGERNPQVVQSAVKAVAELPLVLRCGDERWLAARVALPEDPDLRAEIQALRAELSVARALNATARFESALVALEPLATRAKAIAWEPLIAEVDIALGFAIGKLGRYEEAAEILERGFSVAARSGHDDAAALAANHLTFVVGGNLARYDEALRWADLGEIFVRRAQVEGGMTHAHILSSRGLVEDYMDEGERAVASIQEAIDIWVPLLGDTHPLVGAAYNNLGVAMHTKGEREEGLRVVERGISIEEESLGPDHPSLAGPLNNYGSMLRERGDYDGAIDALTRALRIREDSLEPDHPAIAFSLNNLGFILAEVEQFEVAIASLERAIAIRETKLGPGHPLLSTSLFNLGNAHRSLGNFDEAGALLSRALEIRTEAYDPSHLKIAEVLHSFGLLESELGNFELARAYHERTLEICRAKPGNLRSPLCANALVHLARALVGLGELDTARQQLDRGEAMSAALDTSVLRDRAIGPSCPLSVRACSEPRVGCTPPTPTPPKPRPRSPAAAAPWARPPSTPGWARPRPRPRPRVGARPVHSTAHAEALAACYVDSL